MTNRPTEMSGLVTNARSEAVKEYSLVVFAQDRDLWRPGSRFIRSGRPDQDGRFKVSGLPVGFVLRDRLRLYRPGRRCVRSGISRADPQQGRDVFGE